MRRIGNMHIEYIVGESITTTSHIGHGRHQLLLKRAVTVS
jgi:hypothetical protein